MNKITSILGGALLLTSSMSFAAPISSYVAFEGAGDATFSINSETNLFNFANGVKNKVLSAEGDFASFLSQGAHAIFYAFGYGDSFVSGSALLEASDGGIRFELNKQYEIAGNFVDLSGEGQVVGTASHATVSEPASIALLGLGLVGFGIARSRKKA